MKAYLRTAVKYAGFEKYVCTVHSVTLVANFQFVDHHPEVGVKA